MEVLVDCKAVNRALSVLRDFAISEGERDEMCAHLEVCSACRFLEKQMDKMDEMMKGDYLDLCTPAGSVNKKPDGIGSARKVEIQEEILRALEGE
jgi:hypothetical protein